MSSKLKKRNRCQSTCFKIIQIAATFLQPCRVVNCHWSIFHTDFIIESVNMQYWLEVWGSDNEGLHVKTETKIDVSERNLSKTRDILLWCNCHLWEMEPVANNWRTQWWRHSSARVQEEFTELSLNKDWKLYQIFGEKNYSQRFSSKLIRWCKTSRKRE